MSSGYQEKFYFNPGDTGFKVCIGHLKIVNYELLSSVNFMCGLFVFSGLLKISLILIGIPNQICENWSR